MPFRKVVSKELASFLGVLSHPDRILILHELSGSEKDVSTLAEALQLNPTRVSQQLSLLRSHRLVVERREGRHVYYHLEEPDLSRWLVEGVKFLERDANRQSDFHSAVVSAVDHWGKARRRPPRAKKNG